MDAPRARTAPALLEEMAARYPQREAVVGGGRRYTYAELRAEARAFARGLHALGVRPGEKVAILMGNLPEWLIVDFAIGYVGATMVSVNTWATERELHYLLSHSDTSLLVAADRYLNLDYAGMLEALRDSGRWPDGLREVICHGPGRPGWAIAYDDVAPGGAGVAEAVLDEAVAGIDGEDVAYLLYTSGSTSSPKGVPLQHYALIENMWGIGERQHLDETDRVWLAVSLFWGFGCENALFSAMTHGATLVLQEHFDAGEALRLIEAERCTVYYGTPNITRALYEHPDRKRYDISSLRKGVTIGTPEQIQMAIDLGIRDVCNIYGLTEVYANATLTDAHAPLEVRLHSVGPALPGMEVVVADPETHAPLPPGEVGEIKVRGYVTPGYYKDPAKNAQAFDADGFFLTGDLGYLDEAGLLYFRGRLKEMIKTGGINVSPVEVEEVLGSHDAIEQAYVVGLPDAERDEIVAAVVVLAEGQRLDAGTLRAWCRERLAAYKVPRAFRFATDGELPLTSTRKLQKNRLSELFEEAATAEGGKR